jgi:hypothetical protein
VKRALILAIGIVFCPLLWADPSPLAWVNGARAAAGAPPVSPDPLLSLTAERWASLLSEAGVLSHHGADGTAALDRYRALGGTEVHVGEILGAGPGLEAVEKGWMASASHRRLALDASWTHVGWGSAPRGSGGADAPQVWVMVFCQRLVRDLAIDQRPDVLIVTGRFTASDAAQAMFFAGLSPVEPSAWDRRTGAFRFDLAGAAAAEGYFRLGYRDHAGGFSWTNAFTWPPGTGFPAGPARSAAPGPRP